MGTVAIVAGLIALALIIAVGVGFVIVCLPWIISGGR